MITEARRNYYKNLIDSSACKPKKLWSSLNAILHRSARSILPTASSSGSLATKFMKFFSDKITKLNANLVSTNISPHSNPTVPPPILSSFSPATQEEVRNVILSMSDSTCSLDFLPTKLLKSCLPALLTPITNLINLCIAESTVPSEFKHALITPLLKKDSLPKDDLSSYRPISNLNFLSKVLERIINNRLLTHLNSFPSLSPFQSAYRKFHSVETALLKIQNDLLLAIDKKKVSAVVLLDLSAAFDTVDHQILLTRMSSHFGIQGSAMEFLSSYLISRTQSVVIDSSTSTPTLSLSGVPQGSILGPLLFSLYTTPLATELLSSGLSFHMYADDTQLYISFSANNSAGALAHLTATLDTVHSWLSTNRLSLNPSKTEFLIVGSKQQRDKLNFSSFTFGGNTISYAPAVRNLGVMFDSNLSFDSQISNVCRLSHFQIRQIRQIRPALNHSSAVLLANALVSSKLDLCNSLYYNLPQCSLKKLQLVQNALARSIFPNIRKYDHVSTAIRDLHWLPVEQRIIFKVATITYKVLHHNAPSYLSDIVIPYKPTRQLRSDSKGLLTVPRIDSAAGRRSFSYAAPNIWNSLPEKLRTSSSLAAFRSQLKTHLFPP